jgi:hypothetical protein
MSELRDARLYGGPLDGQPLAVRPGQYELVFPITSLTPTKPATFALYRLALPVPVDGPLAYEFVPPTVDQPTT